MTGTPDKVGLLSVVIPMWNEEASAARAVEAIVDTLVVAAEDRLVDEFEVVTVDDASTDSTRRVLDKMASCDPRIRVVGNERNRGLGGAVRTGLAASRGDVVLYTDADLPCEPAELLKALRILRFYGADIVSAYRHDRAGEGLRRMLYSHAWNGAIRAAFGLRVRDVNFAFKLMRRSVIEAVPLTAEGSFIDAELLIGAQRQGFRIVQFGVDYFPRTRGTSTLSSFGTITRMVADATRYPLHRAPHANRGSRILIVGGDDFGLTEGISRGIIRAHDEGILTATSVLAVGPAFSATAPLLHARPSLDVGVHLAAVGEDPPLLPPGEVPTLVGPSGELPLTWQHFLRRAVTGAISLSDLRKEFAAQIDAVLEAGLRPSHLDTHQHLHLWPPLSSLVCDLACERGIPAVRLPRARHGWRRFALAPLSRHMQQQARRRKILSPDWSIGLEEAGGLDSARLVDLIEAAGRTHAAAVELVCHPGIDPDPPRARYRWGYRWADELTALCHPSVRSAVENSSFVLGTFGQLAEVQS